ncbi:MAG: CoA transferase [Candidatus Dormibacteraeota bacterium]|uniref:CoA transferase n=1 Tax=Candidatus Dormiibacter inghamiae TaxID=3127013 RepID=A0A934KAZ2_9BACT|nr:CoA transferase [Candidatus Dormibacteraeota bacterium]MBJ7606321.1 CoA transferase [Candidatus Dormibacteraeota bacterium]
MHGPLEGIRVVEVGNYMAAPFCTMQLADLGAEVIKVENPAGGDEVRQAGPFLGDQSSPFLRLNRNKRSLALDLKPAAGKAVFRRLVESADVVVENLRPGTMARLELDYARLAEINQGLIYVAVSGWGQDGPLAPLAGLDIMAQARSGLMSITGEVGGDPVKVGVPICDLVCALYGALAAVSALRARDQTGQGQFIDVSLLEAGVSLTIWEAGRYFATGEVSGPQGSAHQNNAPYQAVRAADGWVTVGATTPRNWPAFCRALGLERLLENERYASNEGRFEDRSDLITQIEAVTTTAPVTHWLEVLEAAGVPCAPIQDIAQVYADPHLNARSYFWEGIHPTLGSVRQLGSPMRLATTPPCRDSAAPLLGEHTLAVLELLGYTEEELQNLREQQVISSPEP